MADSAEMQHQIAGEAIEADEIPQTFLVSHPRELRDFMIFLNHFLRILDISHHQLYRFLAHAIHQQQVVQLRQERTDF